LTVENRVENPLSSCDPTAPDRHQLGLSGRTGAGQANRTVRRYGRAATVIESAAARATAGGY
jgi:hypothetical protein